MHNNKRRLEEYQRLRRYDVVSIGGDRLIIVPVKEYYPNNEEMFQIVHGGRNRIEKHNLQLYEACQKKTSLPRNGLVVKPILNKEMHFRCQVDLIDMESQADNEYKYRVCH